MNQEKKPKQRKERRAELKRCLILDNIRSVHNVGSIFRTADAVGIDIIYLIGQTPTPIDRFGRDRRDLQKVALGAEKSVNWKYFKNEDFGKLLDDLKEKKIKIISLEQSPNSIDYKKTKFSSKTATTLIVGNEVSGISTEILSKSDCIIEIPMNGKKESLNVSVATGIVLYRIFDR